MSSRPKPQQGFTIVELLVAAAITVVIVVLLGTMFGSLTSTASRANQRTDAFRDARAALQLMERDLSNLVRTRWDIKSSPTPTPPPAPFTRPVAFFALKNIYADSVTGNQQLYALIAAKNAGPGDVCSVGYYCSWEGQAYVLRRFWRDSTSTFATISSTPVPSPAYIPAADPSPGPSPALYDSPNATTDDLLAKYVWNLRITAYDTAGTLLSGYDSSGTLQGYPYVCDLSAITPNQMPAAIEISFRAMSAEAARTVIAVNIPASDWMDESSSNYIRLIKPHAYEFRTRIKL